MDVSIRDLSAEDRKTSLQKIDGQLHPFKTPAQLAHMCTLWVSPRLCCATPCHARPIHALPDHSTLCSATPHGVCAFAAQ